MAEPGPSAPAGRPVRAKRKAAVTKGGSAQQSGAE
jgi:hypothetical protein